MSLEIVPARLKDLNCILEIYAQARRFMAAAGNPHQWEGGYPGRALVEADIAGGRCFLCREGQEILGVFTYFFGPDPTYGKIYAGRWLREGPYGVMHRVAVTAHGRGVAAYCFAHCFSLCGDLRMDTHRDNLPMQRAFAKNGFRKCGIIYLENGEERLAFQKIE